MEEEFQDIYEDEDEEFLDEEIDDLELDD